MMSCCCWFKQGPSPRVNIFSLSSHMRWRNLCLLCTWVFVSGSHLTLRRQCLFPAEASNTVLAPNVSLQRLIRVPTHNHTLHTSHLEFHLQAFFIRITYISLFLHGLKPVTYPPPPLRDVGYVYARKRHTDCLFRLVQASKQVCTRLHKVVSIFFSFTTLLEMEPFSCHEGKYAQ